VSIQQHGDIVALRQHLFDSINRLSLNATPEEIERAKAIADTAQVIVNTAKVEIDFIKATGSEGGSNFIPLAPATGTTVVAQKPGLRVTQHRLKD
jgi:hypothetical protein